MRLIALPAVKEVTIALAAGFNLVSWPVDTYSNPVEAAVGEIRSVLLQVQGFETAYVRPNGGASGAKIYTPAGGIYNTLTVTDHRLGYWIKTSAAASLRVRGAAIDHAAVSVTMAPGFNLVSYLPPAADSTRHALSSCAARLVQVQTFETPLNRPSGGGSGAKVFTLTGGIYNTLKVMAPRLGYWIRVSARDTLGYPRTAATRLLPPAALDDDGAQPTLTEVTPTNQWVVAYGRLVTGSGAPVGPGALVEVVDASGVVAGASATQHAGYYGYLPVYLDDPETEADEGAAPGEVLCVRVDGQLVTGNLRWGQFGDLVRLDLTVPDNRQAPVLAEGLAGYLYPAFPNPANPSTRIRFILSSPSDTRLSVYDAAGQRIGRLVDAHLSAGEYAVVWDGRNDSGEPVASGVYLCELQTRDTRAVRRFVLLR
jgi:hypothetical protein